MKLYKDICFAWRSRTSAEIFFSQIDWCHKRLKNRSTVILQRTLPWIFRKCYFFFHNVFNNHGKVMPVKINYSFVAKNFRQDFEAKCRSFHIVEIRLNSLCFQWIFEPNVSSIYLKPSQLFCNIGVPQYSQKNTVPDRVSFFINSLQLQAIPIKKGTPALAFCWQLKFLINSFF